MLGKLRIRGKLALVVAFPLLAVALLTLPPVLGAMDRADRAGEVHRSMQVANQVTSLVTELRQERLLSLGYLFGVEHRSRLVGQSARVADRISGVGHDTRDGTLPELPDSVVEALAGADTLDDLRERVLAGDATSSEVIAGFGAVTTGLIDSLGLMDNIDLADAGDRQVAALDASLRINEVGSLATHHLLVVAATGDTASATQYVAALMRLDDHIDRFTQYATAEQGEQLGLLGDAYAEREETGAGEMLGADPYEVAAGQPVSTLFRTLVSLNQLGRFVESTVITDVLTEMEERGQASLRTAYLMVLGAVLVLAAVVVMTALLARAVIRPLLGLTASAGRVADVADAELARVADDESEAVDPARLDPLQVSGRDEIGDLARAFERVQHTAVRLVERQAASRRNVALMFAYLGRRTQNLVGRQLTIIDQLERHEADENRLADLYRLDHISSRLRRNAGSLVALSGSVGADEHVAPLSLTDTVRLALGEIEEYDRVDVTVPSSIAVAPAILGDLVLVLAELMENAATFSPPHTRVEVSAEPAGSGVEVSIVDHGIGMSPERLAEENARLTRRERLDLAPTEVLGLFVVGRLARRHGLRVALSPTPGGGVTAVVGIDRQFLLPAEPASRVIATATIVENGGTGGAAWQPGSFAPLLPELLPPAVNVAALTRASEVLMNARRWNAFALPPTSASEVPALPAAPATESGVEPEPDGGDQPEPDPDLAATTRTEPKTDRNGAGTGRPVGRAAPVLPPGDPPTSRAESADRATGLRAGLRRRVPGATLDDPPRQAASSGRPGLQPTSSPHEARRLVEQLQDGVTRALSEIRSSGGTKGDTADDR